ncbi:hypothetical protein [Pseudonocardia sp.]|jgi:hypothetical protein|uniref:hypothetical protein n=1 Tax=Pseudonocardia sp. TaxID=60912 RepID=UPI003D1276C5
MSALTGLTEVARRAARAELTARSVAWQSGPAIDTAASRVAADLDDDRSALANPRISAVQPSAVWRHRLGELVAADRDDHDDPVPADAVAAAAQAEADADAAVAVARLSLLEAHRAVLEARAAALRAGDTEEVASAVRGYRLLPPGHPALRHTQVVGADVRSEFTNVLRTRPRSILVKLAVSLGIGLAYLGFVRLFRWDTYSELVPFLALYALSGVIGGVVCTNALSWDAGRVREALTSGKRLWHLLLSKNATLFALVGAVGLVLCTLLAWWADDFDAFLAALGELLTMMLVWLGVGNMLSVLAPLRVEPLTARRHDGTLRPFLLSFAVSYVIGLGVNFLLTWKVWAKQSMIDELGGTWVPLLALVASALVTYVVLTVLAVNLADRPRVRRALLREMVDHRAAATT